VINVQICSANGSCIHCDQDIRGPNGRNGDLSHLHAGRSRSLHKSLHRSPQCIDGVLLPLPSGAQTLYRIAFALIEVSRRP
jgi:hypothetical protein